MGVWAGCYAIWWLDGMSLPDYGTPRRDRKRSLTGAPSAKSAQDSEPPFFTMSLVALYEPVIRSPVHARRLSGQVIAGVWIIRVQTADDFEHRPRSPIRLRFPNRNR